jgi:CrcB protein
MPDFLLSLGLVAIGGGIGGMARFWLSGVVARRFGETFPWGTMVVNVTGAAVIGALGAVLLEPDTHAIRHLPLWAALAVGLLGSYTTVSSFSLQTLALARNGEIARALGNIVLSLVLCLAAAAGSYVATTLALTQGIQP